MPNYLITGDDEYIRRREEKKLRDKYLKPSEQDLNYAVFEADSAENIMDSLATMPFLSDKRVVLLRNIQNASDDLLSTVSAYLETPCETAVLIMTASAKFKKKKICKEILEKVEEIDASVPDENRLRAWIQKFFRGEGIEISPSPARLIIDLKGDDTKAIRMELEKLVDFSGGEPIRPEHVEKVVGRSVTEVVFKLVDAINAGNAEWAFRILDDLYFDKKQPQEILGYLGYHLRMMQKVVLNLQRGVSPGGLASAIGKPAWLARKYSSQAPKYPVSRLYRWGRLLLETDRDIKTGKRPAPLAMEMLIVRLIGKKAARARR